MRKTRYNIPILFWRCPHCKQVRQGDPGHDLDASVHSTANAWFCDRETQPRIL